ncbi:MAG: pyridoxamine 5'-phosphate oxidase family protein [Rhodospirillaceae bacterium]|nr:pyridoxamine 5'-phosphate oxidase family protein [Rhodospirillaceae bacterium]
MTERSETLQNFLSSLKSPDDIDTGALTEGAVFMALAVNVPGRDDVLARMTAEDTGAIYRSMTWGAPEADGEALQIRGTLPEGGRLGGVILTVHFDGDQISILQQQNLPGSPGPATAVKLNQHIKDSVNGALGVKNPMLVSYTDESGQPVLSFRGSTQIFSDDQLAIWVRNPEGSFIRSIAKNPKVAFMYRDEGTRCTYQFQGRAHVDTDPAVRAQVYDAMAQVERDHDFARVGVALIIELDLVQGFAGLGPSGPVDPVRMVRED